jgi:hypothetical protein
MLIRTAKRVAVAVIGGTVLLIGLLLVVLPGPALLVIPAGLATRRPRCSRPFSEERAGPGTGVPLKTQLPLPAPLLQLSPRFHP